MGRNSDWTFYGLCLVAFWREDILGYFGFGKFCVVPLWGFVHCDPGKCPNMGFALKFEIFIKVSKIVCAEVCPGNK